METNQPALVARGRRVILYGLIPAVIVAALALNHPAFLTRLEYVVYDAMLRVAGTHAPGGMVAIVDIDERSLSSIGQWPWRRDLLGQLVGRLRELGAAVVALDIVFPEPDRHEHAADASGVAPHEDSQGVHGPTTPDATLADILREHGGRVVLGYAFTFEPSASGSNPCVLHPIGLTIVRPREAGVQSPIFRATGAVCSLPVLAKAAGASGFLNAAPDVDGTLRRMPLLLELDGHVYPALALAAVVATTGTRDIELRVTNVNTTSLIFENRNVPLDGKSNLLLRYRGKKRTFPSVSAADVLGGKLSADAFRGKVVFVGATALGTQEVMATPLGTLFAVEVQATVADNLLRQDFIRQPEHARSLQTLFLLGLGVAVVLLVRRTGVAWGTVAVLTGVAALWGGAGWVFSAAGVFLSPLFPSLCMVSTLAAVAFATLTEERTAAKAAERSARRETEVASHVKDEFLSTVSHELRTPLTAIHGWTQILVRNSLKDEQKRHALATIERNVREETRLIENLLDVSDVTRGRLALDVRPVDLSAVLQRAVDVVRPALDAKGIRLQTIIDPGIGPIPGDPERLQQIVWNLLSNAVKFTPEGGNIQFRLEHSGSHVQIVVSDSGVGISPEFLPQIFERFRQQDGRTTRRYGGLGLGLAIARHLVELHGGTITAESEGEGRGATFRVRLPLTLDQRVRLADQSQADSRPAG